MNKLRELAKAKKGRPKVKDGTGSHTVCLRKSEYDFLVRKYRTLTEAIKTLLPETN